MDIYFRFYFIIDIFSNSDIVSVRGDGIIEICDLVIVII
jgi:hypothetical protein